MSIEELDPADGAKLSEATPTIGPAVVVKFKSSSQPKGQDGYEVALTSAATKDQVTETVLLAAIAREQMQLILGGATVAQLREAGALEAELAALHQAELATACPVGCEIDHRHVSLAYRIG